MAAGDGLWRAGRAPGLSGHAVPTCSCSWLSVGTELTAAARDAPLALGLALAWLSGEGSQTWAGLRHQSCSGFSGPRGW